MGPSHVPIRQNVSVGPSSLHVMAAKHTTSKSPLRLFRRWPLTTATMSLGGLALGALVVSACQKGEEEPAAVAKAEQAVDRSAPEADEVDPGSMPTSLEEEPMPEFEEATENRADWGERPTAGILAPPSDSADFDAPAEPAAAMPLGGAEAPTATARPMPASPRKKAKGKRAGGEPGYRGFDGKDSIADGFIGGEGSGGGALGRYDDEDSRYGKYDNGIQARQLTAGTTDDVSDSQGYAKYLRDSQTFIDRLDLPQSYLDIEPNLDRHNEQPRAVQIALVIDTTSSMSDELEYLKVEMRTIAEKVAHEFPGVEQEFALIAYRDQGDEYVVHAGGFQSLHGFVDDLGKEFSGGGGDYPEAMDQAMENASKLQWDRSDKTAKLTFLVADAPPHHGNGVSTFVDEVESLRNHNVAMYPVAASGVDDETELLMRTSAHATGGQYIFLTDHSGIGSAHKDPNVDQYKVETLHDAMLKMIRTELGAQDTQRVVHVDQQEPRVDIDTQLAVPQPEAEQTSFFGRLVDALGDHFGFAAIFALGLFAAIGVDATFGKRNKS